MTTADLFPFEGYFCSLTKNGSKRYFESLRQACFLLSADSGRPFEDLYDGLRAVYHLGGGEFMGYLLTPGDSKAATKAASKRRQERNKQLRRQAEEQYLKSLSLGGCWLYMVRKTIYADLKDWLPKPDSRKERHRVSKLTPWERKVEAFKLRLVPAIKAINPEAPLKL